MLSFFGCSKFSVQVCNTSDVHTEQTFTINWSKMQLSWVLMLYYPYKTMFSAYKSVIVSPCVCDLFVSKVTKITWYLDVRFWQSFFGTFSVCNDCILKSTTACLLKLSVLYIHSFMQVHNTTFQIKTVFNNVLFSTEVYNPLHAHLLALSHIWKPFTHSGSWLRQSMVLTPELIYAVLQLLHSLLCLNWPPFLPYIFQQLIAN